MSRRRPLASPPSLRVRVEREDGVVTERTFAEAFTVGRGDDAGLRLESGLVSRHHAEFAFRSGCWWVRDLGSANGTFVHGMRVVELPLEGPAAVELGQGGPVLYVEVESPARGKAGGDGAGALAPADAASVTQVLDHYFRGDDAEGGQRTQLVRAAYQRVHRSHRRHVRVIVGVALVLLAVALGAALWQRARALRERERVAELTRLAGDLFAQMRAQERQIALLRRSIGAESDSALDSLVARAERLQQAGLDPSTAPPEAGEPPRPDPIALAETVREAEERRRQIEERYDYFVQELGVYRDATPQEQAILHMARVFNESEVYVDAAFVHEVERYIAWWRQHGLAQAVRRADDRGYTPVVVATMRDYGLPPEFFYLGLVESHYDAEAAVGPPTRWGIAKGVWQFIPSTALDYGLLPGPLVDEPRYDPLDERFHFEKATEAAALYLRRLYTDLSQASGLLAMACYNWGEGRVLPALRALPELDTTATARDSVAAQFDAQFEGIPQDPQQRSYWRFLNTYGDRMPAETRDYVMRIFSAAVIGQDPHLFGFDFDDPLGS